MVKQFTKEKATQVADRLIKGNVGEVSMFTDGVKVTFEEDAGKKALGGFDLPKGRGGGKPSVLRVNVQHFKNSQGRVLKGQLVDFLYKEGNSLIERHQKEVSSTQSKRFLDIHKKLAEKDRLKRGEEKALVGK